MATYRSVAYDILEIFKQQFDDKEFQIPHIVFWIQTIANRLTAQHSKKFMTGAFSSTFDNILIQKATTSSVPDTIKDRKFVTLPENVFDLENDKAIQYISYELNTGCAERPAFTSVFFQPTTVMKAYRLEYNPYESPKPSNPYFYRVKNKVYLLGIECIDVPSVEMCLLTAQDPTDVCDIDDEVRLPDELVPILRAEILSLGRFALQIPRERINEGSDMTTQRITQAGTELPSVPEQAASSEQNESEQ